MLFGLKERGHDLERIYLDRQAVEEMESMILIGRHIERYAFVRQFIWGRVLDVACGVGYGSYLLGKNPDVVSLKGVDIDAASIDWAKQHFADERVSFERDCVTGIAGAFDCLVSLETLEHLEDPLEFRDLTERCSIKELIISFPHKKTTHYNPFHRYDLREADVEHVFDQYKCVGVFKHYDSTIMRFIRNLQHGVTKPKRWTDGCR